MRPGGQLGTGRLQHPLAQGQNQATLLRQRNELNRRHHAPLRVLPAHQHLHTRDAPCPHHLRLVVQQQLLLGQCGAQVGLQRGAGRHFGLHLFLKKAQCVAPGGFGLEHGQLCLLEGLFTLCHRRAAKQRDADPGRGVMVNLLQLKVGLERANDVVAHALCLCGGLQLVFGQVLQHHHKLIAAQPCHRVAIAGAAAQALRHLHQQSVTLLVAQGVVDRLEIVQIHKQQRVFARMPRAGVQRLIQPVQQQPAVGQMGQLVVERQVVNLLLGPHLLADVAEYAHVMRCAALRVPDCADAQPLGVNLAVFAPVPDFTDPDASCLQRLGHAVIKLRIVAARGQDVRPLADGFFGAVAGDLGECLVDAQNAALRIGDHHALL